MATKLEQLVQLATSLTLQDIVDPKTSKMEQIWEVQSTIINHIRSLSALYNSSEYAKIYADNYRIQLAASQAAKATRDWRRESWARDNLKPGMIVKVTGAKSHPKRLVQAINKDDFTNVQLRELRGGIFETLPQMAKTMYNKVTHYRDSDLGEWKEIP